MLFMFGFVSNLEASQLFFFLTFDKFIGTYEAQTLCGGLLYTDQP